MKLLKLMLLLCLVSPYQCAEFTGEKAAVSFIQKLEKSYLSTLQSKSVAKQKKCKIFISALHKHFAMKTIGNFSLGRNRRLFNAQDRERFYEIFTKMLAAVYVDKFQHFGDVRLFNFSARKEDRNKGEWYTVVCMAKTPNNSDVQLKWDVVKGENDFKVVNVAVDGISMNVLQRDEFAQQIVKNGYNVNAFLGSLEAKYGGIDAGSK